MFKIKRLSFSVILTLVILAAGCAKKTESDVNAGNSVITGTSAEDTGERPVNKLTLKQSNAESGNEITENESASQGVLIDNNEIFFSVDELAFLDDEAGFRMKCSFSNGSDKEVVFSFSSINVNGWRIDGGLWEQAGPGTSQQKEFTVRKSKIEEIGITSNDQIAEISNLLMVYGFDDYELIYENKYLLYKNSKVEENTVFDTKSTEESSVLADNEFVRVWTTGHEINENGDFVVNLCVENKTDSHIDFRSFVFGEINGVKCYDQMRCSTNPHEKAVCKDIWSREKLEEIGIQADEVKEATISIVASNERDFTADWFLEGAFPLTIK